jgi:hypothetical protein
VFNQTIAYRDKKVVGVFVRFSCTASVDGKNYLVNKSEPKPGRRRSFSNNRPGGGECNGGEILAA